MARTYPYIGSRSAVSGGKKCSCCARGAVKRIDVQVNWFRGDDDVFLVCDTHLAMADDGNWIALYADHATTKSARRMEHELATLVPKANCPTCSKRLKQSGLLQHMRDAHGEMTSL